MGDSRDDPRYQAARQGSKRANNIQNLAKQVAESGKNSEEAAFKRLSRAAGGDKEARRALEDLGGSGKSFLRRLTGR
jgi:hypothetical protein